MDIGAAPAVRPGTGAVKKKYVHKKKKQGEPCFLAGRLRIKHIDFSHFGLLSSLILLFLFHCSYTS